MQNRLALVLVVEALALFMAVEALGVPRPQEVQAMAALLVVALLAVLAAAAVLLREVLRALLARAAARAARPVEEDLPPWVVDLEEVARTRPEELAARQDRVAAAYRRLAELQAWQEARRQGQPELPWPEPEAPRRPRAVPRERQARA